FSYNEKGEIDFLKKIISHTEKTKYIFKIARGDFSQNSSMQEPGFSSQIPEDELYIPLNHMIYIGDGYTDLPCFSLLNENRGISIGVFKENSLEKWGEKMQLAPEQKVANLTPADYSENSELSESIILAV